MYKQGILSFTLFFYNVYNGQSGTPLFDNIMIMAYPTAYTFFPILFVGVIDQALKDSTILRHPEVYYIGQQARLFNLKRETGFFSENTKIMSDALRRRSIDPSQRLCIPSIALVAHLALCQGP